MNFKKVSNIESKQNHGLGSVSDRLSNASDATKCRTLPQLSSSENFKTLTDHLDEDDDEVEAQSPDKMKTIFMSLWNNVKFGLFSLYFLC